jgi:3-dehydroquinate dehydratase type I
MTMARSVKAVAASLPAAPKLSEGGCEARPALGYIVGVIASRADLHRALRMRRPPDLFELRLDHLLGNLDDVENKLFATANPSFGGSILSGRSDDTRCGERAPLIITARHPREGGANNLSLKQRHELLARFLPHARYVDVELRSAKALRSLLELARRKNVRRIISFHDFNSTPPLRSLRTKARAARSFDADIFKIATRTDTSAQLGRLLDFITDEDVDLPLSVMGIGKLGRSSRRGTDAARLRSKLRASRPRFVSRPAFAPPDSKRLGKRSARSACPTTAGNIQNVKTVVGQALRLPRLCR